MLARALIGVPLLVACARSSDRPAEQRPPVVVPHAPEGAADEELVEALPEREPRSSDQQAPGRDQRDDSSKQLQVEVTRDGGVFSFSARSVGDGGFSLRFSGSLSIGSDGGSTSVTIAPDAGAP
jgi:hypothetical protein